MTDVSSPVRRNAELTRSSTCISMSEDQFQRKEKKHGPLFYFCFIALLIRNKMKKCANIEKLILQFLFILYRDLPICVNFTENKAAHRKNNAYIRTITYVLNVKTFNVSENQLLKINSHSL
jgi:hypothetical protein